MLIKFFNRCAIRVRTFFWKRVLKSFGQKSRVLGRIKVYYPERVHIGSGTTINEGVILNARMEIIVGDHVHLSPGCIINTGFLDVNRKLDNRKHDKKPVVIQDGVWLASGVIVNPGVTIGKNSVVGSGSVVTRDVPEEVVVVGAPAKILKYLS